MGSLLLIFTCLKFIPKRSAIKLSISSMAFVRTVVANAKPRLALFKTYAKAELAPPLRPAEFVDAAKAAGQLGTSLIKGRCLLFTPKDALTNLGVLAEICCWFYVGECIGKGSLIGYNV